MQMNLQTSPQDCGLYIIQSLHHHFFKRKVSISNLKSDALLTSQGLNVTSLIKLGLRYGIEIEGFKVTFAELLQENSKIIAIVNRNNMPHYVVCWRKKNKFVILDPAQGKKQVSLKSFEKIYSGFILTYEKGEFNYSNEISKKSPLSYLAGNYHLIAFILLSLLIGTIITFVSTIFSKIIFDKVIPNHLHKTLVILTLGFAFLACIRTFNNFVKAYLNKKITNSLAIDLQIKYMQSLTYSSIIDLEKLNKTDHIKRLSLVFSVALFISTAIQIIFHEIIILAIATGLLLWISGQLFLIAISSAFLLFVSTLFFGYVLQEKYQTLIPLQEKEFLQSSEITYLSYELKNKIFRKKIMNNWQSSFFQLKLEEYSIWKYSNYQGIINSLVSFLAPIFLTYISVELIFKQNLTPGTMLMFIGIFHHFINPTISLSDFILKYKQNIKHLHLVFFVLNFEKEKDNIHGYTEGKIESFVLENLDVSFDKRIFKIKHLDISKNLILVGPNGIGKSVFLKTLNFSLPFEGSIIVNNLDSSYWSKQYLQNRTLLITEDEFMPTLKIYDYLTLGARKLENDWAVNDKKYQLTKFLLQNGINIKSYIKNNGQNFSAGQRQIIKLMKIFVKEWDFIYLDEAFENVSQNNFLWFKDNLAKLKCKFIEVSHSKRYMKKSLEVNFEIINQSF